MRPFIGPSGRIVGLREIIDYSQSASIAPICEFVDGCTGQTLHTTQGIGAVVIGDRWIVGLLITQVMPGGTGNFVLIDMDDNFAEHVLGFFRMTGYGFGMYEPPPGGMNEMLEMREAGIR